MFTRHLNAYWTKCGDRLNVGECGVLDGRCSSLCLTETEVSSYFFFAFIRDPVERFYSCLKESVRMGHHLTPEAIGERDADAVLDAVHSGACGVDHHLESQALALSTPIAFSCGGRQLAVPVDFVGRVDHLADDFLDMLARAADFTGRSLDPPELEHIARSLRTNVGNVGVGTDRGIRAGALRTDSLDARVFKSRVRVHLFPPLAGRPRLTHRSARSMPRTSPALAMAGVFKTRRATRGSAGRGAGRPGARR